MDSFRKSIILPWHHKDIFLTGKINRDISAGLWYLSCLSFLISPAAPALLFIRLPLAISDNLFSKLRLC